MMGKQADYQHKMFIAGFNLDKRIRSDHLLRKISEQIDFDFIYKEVKDAYGKNGNVSVPPPVILKIMLLLMLYNVRSERELIDTIPERLDWLWFLGYDLNDEIPNHSVLSKARSRWGVEIFKSFFERIVWQCVESGLVNGNKLFVDASLIDANASNNSVIDKETLKKHLKQGYQTLEERLDDLGTEKVKPANERFTSTTDPDASVTRQFHGKSKLRYKTHRAVDPKHEVITATKITPGSVDDGHMLKAMIEEHQQNTQRQVDTVAADQKYGSIDNYLQCYDLGIKAHIPSVEDAHKGLGTKKDIFPKEAFQYEAKTDTYICPAGEVLRKHHYFEKRRHYEYQTARGICAGCDLRERCTRSKTGRTLKRHIRQAELTSMLKQAKSKTALKDLKTRQHLSERSFARSTRYGFKRARWRRLWRMEIQDYLIAAIENISILIRHSKAKLSKNMIHVVPKVRKQSWGTLQRLTRGAILRIKELFSLPISCFMYTK